jgi:UDP-N-acetylmuramyl pentapeptide phosphotransferase/UDP-N-acetylglucosamine-1-phosphate transferase
VTVVLAFAVGFVAVRLVLVATRDVLASPLLERENYRAHRLPTAAGIVLVVAVIGVEGVRAAAGALGLGDAVPARSRVLVLVAVVGFGLLGFLDDLVGSGDARGFRGHLRALAGGRVTTGLAKLGGGAALALVLAAAAHGDTGVQPFADGALVALAANLGNLLDRAPGRTTKFALAVYVPVAVVCGTGATGVATAIVLGGALGLLPEDLRERLMLGDTGANVIGAVLGLAVVLETSASTRASVAAALLALNLASEVVSFGRVIGAVAPLRGFDRFGRRSAP